MLAGIRSVYYRFDHDTFRKKDYVSESRAERFAVSYTGWGCLGKVDVTVKLVDGTEQEFDFNMCRSGIRRNGHLRKHKAKEPHLRLFCFNLKGITACDGG